MLSIIVPCYNEYNRLDLSVFEKFITTQQCGDVALIFVDDGSTDDTLHKLTNFAQKHTGNVAIVNLKNNVGKAEAVRTGFMHVLLHFPFSHIGYIDADLSVTPDELLRIYHLMTAQHLSIAFGSRVALFGSNIQRKPHRHYLGRVFSTFVSVLLNIVVYDTQCGAKIFSHSIAEKVFEKPFVSRWFFDVEIIARLHQMYSRNYLRQHCKEVPLNSWIHKKESKVKLTDFFLCPYYLIRIKMKYKAKLYDNHFKNEEQAIHYPLQ